MSDKVTGITAFKTEDGTILENQSEADDYQNQGDFKKELCETLTMAGLAGKENDALFTTIWKNKDAVHNLLGKYIK